MQYLQQITEIQKLLESERQKREKLSRNYKKMLDSEWFGTSSSWQHWRNIRQEMCCMLQSQTSVVHYYSIIIWQLYQVCCAWPWGTRRGLLCLTVRRWVRSALPDSGSQSKFGCVWQLGTGWGMLCLPVGHKARFAVLHSGAKDEVCCVSECRTWTLPHSTQLPNLKHNIRCIKILTEFKICRKTDRQRDCRQIRYWTLERQHAETIPNIKTLPATPTSWRGR